MGIDEPGIDKIKATLPIRAFPTFFMVRDGKIINQLVTISFVFGDYEIENVDIVTDVFVPPELSDKREQLMDHVRASGKGEVEPTMTGFRIHIDNDCRFMKAMDMKRTSTYGEMRAGLELQGFSCQ